MALSDIVRRARTSMSLCAEYHRVLRETETFSDRELVSIVRSQHAIRGEACRCASRGEARRSSCRQARAASGDARAAASFEPSRCRARALRACRFG